MDKTDVGNWKSVAIIKLNLMATKLGGVEPLQRSPRRGEQM